MEDWKKNKDCGEEAEEGDEDDRRGRGWRKR